MSKLDKLFTKENIRILKEYKEMVGGSSNVYEKIIQWFIKNPNPPDSKVHALADQFGADHDKFESHIYKILSDLIHKGRSKNFKGKYDPKELAMGIEVEKEHMPYPSIAEKIAKDHLAELPDYYTRLKKMEEKGGVTENLITELFIKPCDAFKLPASLEKDAEMLRLAIIAELDAANLYKRMADECSMPDIAKVFRSIADEEIVHVGEFDFLLEKIDPTHDKNEDKGEDEAEELTGWDDDSEPEVSEAFARLVKSTVMRGRRVPVRGVAKRVTRRAGKRYVKHKTREQSKK